MKSVILTKKNKNCAHKIRESGFTPVVVYGRSINVSSYMVNTKDILSTINTLGIFYKSTILELIIDNNKHLAIIKDVSLHQINNNILHIDFYVPEKNKKFISEVPVVIENANRNIDLKAKGILISTHKTINIYNTLENFISKVTVDVLNLAKKHTIHAKDIDGITFLNPNLPLASIK